MAPEEFYLTFQYPVLLEPIRVINPFPLSEAKTRVIVRWDFPVFTINSALVIPGSSRRQLNTACSRSLIWSFIRSFSWPDKGDLFLSILENSILKSVSVFSYLISTPPQVIAFIKLICLVFFCYSVVFSMKSTDSQRFYRFLVSE